jgi:hypothetical protein
MCGCIRQKKYLEENDENWMKKHGGTVRNKYVI